MTGATSTSARRTDGRQRAPGVHIRPFAGQNAQVESPESRKLHPMVRDSHFTRHNRVKVGPAGEPDVHMRLSDARREGGDSAPTMTAKAAASHEPEPVGGRPSASTAAMVRLVRESWARLEPRADDIAHFFYGMLFSLAPETRDMFPINMDVQRSRFMRALVHMVQMIDRPDELMPFLRQLGRDHRKFGVISAQYESFGTALLASLKRHCGAEWTPAVERAWAEAYTIMARTMLEASEADEGPAYWPAEVIEHHQISWDLARVRVQPDYPVPYQAGQYLSVETPHSPRLWRFLTPANAPRDDASIDFHVRAVPGGWVSRAVVAHTTVGDIWRLGPPLGRLSVDRDSDRDVLMVAGGTGVATMLALIEDLAQWGENPRVHLFYGGRTSDDLYALDDLQHIAASNPWLTVVPVLEQNPSVRNAEHGTLADVVTKYGAWADRDVLVSGSPAMIRSTVSRMLVAGTPLDRISYDPFTID
jgi:NAD(P)H-flavin reductase/hemoglobin-like flavoprotein